MLGTSVSQLGEGHRKMGRGTDRKNCYGQQMGRDGVLGAQDQGH